MVTKRELLNNLSNIYKCKVSPGRMFSLEISSSMKERIIRFNWGTKRENLHFFFGQRKMAKNRGICAAHTCIPQYREYPPGSSLLDSSAPKYEHTSILKHSSNQ